MPPPSPPLGVGRIYANYTATVKEVLNVATITSPIDPVVFGTRLNEVLNERIDALAAATNVSVSALTGIVRVEQPGIAATEDTLALRGDGDGHPMFGRRKLQTPLDTSGCDTSNMRVNIEIRMESGAAADRDSFIAQFSNVNFPGIISNITGAGEVALVCAAAVVTDAGRETVNAPPPPPDLGLTVPDDQPLPRTVWIVAIVAATLIFVLCGVCVYYFYFAGRRRSEEKADMKAVDSFAAPAPSEPGETASFFGKRSKPAIAQPRVGYFVLDPDRLDGTE
jgi:hypothetical protein